MNMRIMLVILGIFLLPIGTIHFILNVKSLGISGILIDGVTASLGIFSLCCFMAYIFPIEQQKLEKVE